MARSHRHTAHYLASIARPSQHPSPLARAVDAAPAGAAQDSPSAASAPAGRSSARDTLLGRVVALLDDDDEEELKAVLSAELAPAKVDDAVLESHILALMHRHRDDLNGVPFTPSVLTPKRTVSRPNNPSTATLSKTIPFRPLAHARPHSPSTAGSSASSSLTGAGSPPSSFNGGGGGFLLGGAAGQSLGVHGSSTASSSSSSSSSSTTAGVTGSSPSPKPPQTLPITSPLGSPLVSPRILNASAVEFRPSPKPATAQPMADGNAGGSWPASTSTSPAPPLMRSISASLSYITPPVSAALAAPASAYSTARIDDDDDDFSPFGNPTMSSPYPPPAATYSLGPQDSDSSWPSSSTGSGSYSSSTSFQIDETGGDPSGASYLDASAGMRPIDLLASIFTSLSQHELEVALHRHGYDLDSTMHHLMNVEDGAATRVVASGLISSPVAPKPFVPREGYVVAGGRNGLASISTANLGGGAAGSGAGGVNGGSMSPTRLGSRSPFGGRVCRYYLQGECRRADCRFSHDIERALCRFWLRGQCAKGDQCEFIHNLPSGFDPAALSKAISNIELSDPSLTANGSGSRIAAAAGRSVPGTPPAAPEDFPELGAAAGSSAKARLGSSSQQQQQQAKLDPARARFSSAVKKAAPAFPNVLRYSAATAAPSSSTSSAAAAASSGAGTLTPTPATTFSTPRPTPSPRLTLRPPTLLPTLPTGAATNVAYLSARSHALQLGAQRNSALARAAEAWRRGDGAGAKKFSREGQELNEKMNVEGAVAADKLVRDRKRLVQEAVRTRDSSWSTDPLDRARRGRDAGGGLGVCLGVASPSSSSSAAPTTSSGGSAVVGLGASEREEVLVDLHALHGKEAVDVLEAFLIDLENEHFRGLAYALVGEEKHTGTQDVGRGAGKVRLAGAVKEWLANWGYPWSESRGVLCIDPLTYYAS